MAGKIYADNPPQFFKPNIPNNSPDVVGYSVSVEEDTGITRIFKKDKDGGLSAVGIIEKGGGFVASPIGQFSNQATQAEKDYFTANARKTVTEQAVPVVRRGIGGNAGGGNANINEVLGTNLSSPPPELTPGSIQTSIPDSDASKNIDSSLAKADFVYPTSMRTNQQDRIKFTALSITGRANVRSGSDVDGGIGQFSLGTRETMMLGSVTLPIQPSITDSNGVDWGGANLDPITAYAAAKSLDVAASDNITAAAARALNEAADTFKRELKGGLGKAIAISFAGQAVGAQGLLSRTSGAIVNPNLELLFNGPTLRPFNFTFRLSPRSEEEAKEVKGIINFFKKAMAVKKAKSEIFLKAPNIFKIQYFAGNGSEEHKSLNKIKDCALLGCDVDYTPDGSYMTFNDANKTMTSYQLTLRFSELDPIYNTNYEGLDNEIGF